MTKAIIILLILIFSSSISYGDEKKYVFLNSSDVARHVIGDTDHDDVKELLELQMDAVQAFDKVINISSENIIVSDLDFLFDQFFYFNKEVEKNKTNMLDLKGNYKGEAFIGKKKISEYDLLVNSERLVLVSSSDNKKEEFNIYPILNKEHQIVGLDIEIKSLQFSKETNLKLHLVCDVKSEFIKCSNDKLDFSLVKTKQGIAFHLAYLDNQDPKNSSKLNYIIGNLLKTHK